MIRGQKCVVKPNTIGRRMAGESPVATRGVGVGEGSRGNNRPSPIKPCRALLGQQNRLRSYHNSVEVSAPASPRRSSLITRFLMTSSCLVSS